MNRVISVIDALLLSIKGFSCSDEIKFKTVSVLNMFNPKMLAKHLPCVEEELGEISIDWTNGKSFVSVNVGTSGVYFYSELPDGRNPEGTVDINKTSEVIDAVNSLYFGTPQY